MKYKENLKRSQRKDIYYLQKSNNTFPGRLVLKEDSKWVAAAAAPHRGSLGGPGPHPGKENAGAEKGASWERDRRSRSQTTQKAFQVPKTTEIHISVPFSTQRRAEEEKEIKSKERQITEEDRGHNRERNRNDDVNGICLHEREKGGWPCKCLCINVSQKRKYRQYMNRKGGFNRPLGFIAWELKCWRMIFFPSSWSEQWILYLICIKNRITVLPPCKVRKFYLLCM